MSPLNPLGPFDGQTEPKEVLESSVQSRSRGRMTSFLESLEQPVSAYWSFRFLQKGLDKLDRREINVRNRCEALSARGHAGIYFFPL